jgi:plastocyanin
VTWRNASTIQHTATSDPALAQGSYPDSILPEGAEPWDSGIVDPGDTWARRFERLGTYIFFCQIHEQVGMIGTITVTEE